MLIEIESLDDPRVAPYCRLTEAQLKSKAFGDDSLFIAESPKVIKVALEAGYSPVSMLCERRHVDGDAAALIAGCGDRLPVYTGSRQLLASLTGYTLTRGVLCAMRRKELPSVEEVCDGATRLAVIHGVCDTTNIGAIFRSAAALGVDGILLTADSCDPLNRRSVRVSMGSVFLLPWTFLPANEDVSDILRSVGFKSAALALTKDSVPIDSPAMKAEPRLAMILGTEGDGLPRRVIANADYSAIIPMNHNVDSLNVAAASSVAFWQLCRK